MTDENNSNPITDIWSAVAETTKKQISLFQDGAAIFGLTQYLSPDEICRLTSDEKTAQLHNDFKEQFGTAGEEQIKKLIESRALNGGKKHKGEPGYYVGYHYSLPIMLYTMERALNPSTKTADLSKVYDQFVEDVRCLKEKDGNDEKEGYKIPAQTRVQNICRCHLRALQAIRENAQNSENNPLPEREVG